jgi:hypothetical protein
MVEKLPSSGTGTNKWRITIPLTKAESEHIHEIALRNHTSVSVIGHIAVLDLLIADRKGEFSLVPEFLPGAEIHHA